VDTKSKVEGNKREQREAQSDEIIVFVGEIIEISEEAYKMNHVYRPWPQEETRKKKAGNKIIIHEPRFTEVEDRDAA